MASPLFSDNARAALVHLQANQGTYETAPEIAEATGIPTKSITGVLNGLQRKGLVERIEMDGYEKKVVRLTDAGVQADPEAEKPEKAAE